ncbi:alkaline ceramidase 3-like isoform X2 [Leptotrombidium deliense]|uniref:Alkaline ceramidase n=1 Tax=Leptotrombidium deliense TaxID=299467 RepID=A0A443SEE1_9ACAR|nr:alkaline ceramidase 3-like isoform X2 [Leptotrombidium deliense]
MAPTAMGYWGRTTSTIDWCEKNYDTTFYIAEFWNTISSMSMVIPAAFSLFHSLKKQEDNRISISFALLILVGIGTSMFHITLKYEMQLLDELPMVWGTLYVVYILASIAIPQLEQSSLFKVLLTVYGIITTTVYLVIQLPVFHQTSFGILVGTILFLNIYMIFRKFLPGPLIPLTQGHAIWHCFAGYSFYIQRRELD